MGGVALSDREKRALRQRGHHLKPVVQVGKDGVSPGVIEQLDQQLTAHELVKVKLLQSCPVDKDEAPALLAQACDAAVVQRIGRTALLFRPRPEGDEDVELPEAGCDDE